MGVGQSVSVHRVDAKQVLMVWRGVAEVGLNEDLDVTVGLVSRDMVSVPGWVWRSVRNVGDGALEVLVISGGDGRKFVEFPEATVAAALAAGWGIDPDGAIAPAHLLPVYHFA